MSVRAATLVAMFALAGCKVPTDLGNECAMVKRDPNVDGGRLFIKEGEIKVGANKDFISFGSTDCENLTCVRDADFVRDGGAVDPNAVARGYCSNRCQQGSTCESANPDDDNNAQRRLNCRALLLDAETLRALCNGSDADRAKCKANFGNIDSPYFCARGGVVDGGN